MRGLSTLLGLSSVLVFPPIMRCQGTEPILSFEVASVRRVTTGPTVLGGGYVTQMRGGPGTDDPGRIRYINLSLKTLLLNAFGIRAYQLSGPAWLETEVYEINAKVPLDATKAQFNVMLQNLLKERFSLSAHQETKEFAVYELAVSKNGPKLQEAAEATDDEPPSVKPLYQNDDRYYDLPPGHPKFIGLAKDGSFRISARMQSMAEFAEKLGVLAGRPVLDKTSLTEKYDFKLGFSRVGLPSARPSDPDTPEADLFHALQDQLGLKLEPKKDMLDYLVIDRVDKNPTDN